MDSATERTDIDGGTARRGRARAGDVRGVASVGRAVVIFANSGGKTAEAAAHHNAAFAETVEALAVARAADRAADGIVKVQSELAASTPCRRGPPS